jgi:hypothetical protein
MCDGRTGRGTDEAHSEDSNGEEGEEREEEQGNTEWRISRRGRVRFSFVFPLSFLYPFRCLSFTPLVLRAGTGQAGAGELPRAACGLTEVEPTVDGKDCT